MNISEDPRSFARAASVLAAAAALAAAATLIVALRHLPLLPRPVSPVAATAVTAAQSAGPSPAIQSSGKGPVAVVGRHTYAVSWEFAHLMKEVRAALRAQNYAEVVARLEAANLTLHKSAYEQHEINEFLAYAYLREQNDRSAVRVIEAELSDGFLTQAETDQKLAIATDLSWSLRNLDKVIEFGNRAIRTGAADRDTRELIGLAYYLKQDWSETVRYEEDFANREINAGRTPRAHSLQTLLIACSNLEDRDCERRALEKLVTYDPQPRYWRMLDYLRAEPQLWTKPSQVRAR